MEKKGLETLKRTGHNEGKYKQCKIARNDFDRLYNGRLTTGRKIFRTNDKILRRDRITTTEINIAEKKRQRHRQRQTEI